MFFEPLSRLAPQRPLRAPSGFAASAEGRGQPSPTQMQGWRAKAFLVVFSDTVDPSLILHQSSAAWRLLELSL